MTSVIDNALKRKLKAGQRGYQMITLTSDATLLTQQARAAGPAVPRPRAVIGVAPVRV